MTTPVSPLALGPVSTALEADLRAMVREHGIVVWLDVDGHYSGFVDQLVAAREAGALPFAVHSFRGSHLALMLAVEGAAGGVEKTSLLVHLPGFNQTSVKETPLFELSAGGRQYRKALKTLVTEAAAGRVHPDDIKAFSSQPGLTLAGADAWLAGHLASQKGGLAALLEQLSPAAALDDLLTHDGRLGRCLGNAEDEATLWARLAAWTGLPEGWRETTLSGVQPRAEDVAFVVASWALCVEYVNDLARPPVSTHLTRAKGLPEGVVKTCQAVALRLRELSERRAFYRRTADETEALLADEVRAAEAKDLGKVDTFRFEEDKVLAAALVALERADWSTALEWAAQRLDAKAGAGSFWLREDPTRHSAWQLVRDAARLGSAIAQAGERLGSKGGLEAAVAAYVERGAAVDHAHRHLEQRRVALLHPPMPEFEKLRARLDALRSAWRKWADAWALDFNAQCKEHGFLPPSGLQQRTLFDDVVRPMTAESGITAYFVVDALRFEMGQELFRELEGTAHTTLHLRARLAELPSVTEVGMNVLAPVTQGGKLRPAMGRDGGRVQGFAAGEFRVHNPETRKRAMHDRVGGDTCPWLTLDDIKSRDSTTLKQTIARAKLVVVHSQEIDAAGEKGVGLRTFDSTMKDLSTAWRLLREAGVRRFVITSDHGFLLLEDGAKTALVHGRKTDPMRRHVFSPVAADHAGEVRVALADLGYEGASGHVMFPADTAPFDLGKRAMTFVHGGNSLQERVIPVLTVEHRAAAGGTTLSYAVSARALDGLAGMHCIEVTVGVAAQGALDFGSSKAVELGLRAVDGTDVQVELCHTRGAGQLTGGTVSASVGKPFELFFRLTAPTEARVLLEVHHPSAMAEVTPFTLPERFAVTKQVVLDDQQDAGADDDAAPDPGAAAVPAARTPSRPPRAVETGRAWLEQLPAGGLRQLFEHLAVHGSVTETEATTMLGGPRAQRRFALQMDELAKQAPFKVRIVVVAGVKRYEREGNG